MAQSTRKIAIGFVALASTALVTAVPSPNPYGTPSYECFPYADSIADQHLVSGTQWMGGVTCTGACSLTYTAGYSYGTTWTEGVDLGYTFDQVVNLGMSFTVSETVTTSTAEGATLNCPGGAWTCGLVITPTMVSVTGGNGCKNTAQVECAASDCPQSAEPWGLLIPQTDANHVGAAHVAICACANAPGAGDPGAPPVCPLACEIG